MVARLLDRMNEGSKEGGAPNVVLEVASAKELRKLRWWQQGDRDLHTPDKLAERYSNRHHPSVRAVLDAFYQAAMYRVSGAGPSSSAAVPPEKGMINREMYVGIFTKIG